MIYPTAIEEIRNIEHTLDQVIRPALTRTLHLSTLQTIGGVLRHVAKRLELEDRQHYDEIVLLTPLLGDLRAYLAALTHNPAAVAAAGKIASLLSEAERAPGSYLGPVERAADVMKLREAVSEALRFLLSNHAAHEAGAEAWHDKLRHYLAWQTGEETKIIDPAFVGFGPRR